MNKKTIFANIFAAQTAQHNNRQRELLEQVREAQDLTQLFEHWVIRDFLPKNKSPKDFSELNDAQSYLTKRIEKHYLKAIAKDLEHLLDIEKAEEFKYFNISVEWKKSATWGANPTAIGYDYSGRYSSGSIGGCGYDKLSTAVAKVLNQSKALLKALYLEREKDLKTDLRDLFGYGSGYRILPRFEGGVGVSCYPEIFKKIGFEFRQTGNGKMYDCFEVTKIK